MKRINIILGLKNNAACEKVKDFFENKIGQYFDEGYAIGVVHYTYSRQEIDDAVAGGQYDVVFVLEKMENSPIGQGAVKKWRAANDKIRIILAMDVVRKSSAKTKGLYDISYYDGLFVSELSNLSEIVMLIETGRSRESAYVYYGLADFVEIPRKRKGSGKECAADGEQLPHDGAGKIPVSGNDGMNHGKNPGEDSAGDLADIDRDKNEQEERMDGSDAIYEKKVNIAAADSYGKQEDALPEEMGRQIDERDGIDEDKEISRIEVGSGEKEEDEWYDSEYFEEAKEKTFTSSSSVGSKEHREKPLFQEKAKTEKYEDMQAISGDASKLKVYLAKRFRVDVGKKENGLEGTVPAKERLFIDTVKHYTTQMFRLLEELSLGKTNQEDFNDGLFDYIDSLSGTEADKNYAYTKFIQFMAGYDVLEPLIQEPGVTDIHVLDGRHVRVKKNGIRVNANVSFGEEGRYPYFCKYLLNRHRSRLCNMGVSQYFTDKSFSEDFYLQVSVIDGRINTGGEPELHIRKTPKDKIIMQKLFKEKRMTEKQAAYLLNEMCGIKGILICGKAASGKSTLLNALVDFIPETKSAVVVQYREEIMQGRHPETTVQCPCFEEDNSITVPVLAENALLQDADFYILGDVRGEESLSLYQAAVSGYIALACITVEAPMDGIDKVIDYAVIQNPSLQREAAIKGFTERIGTIVHMDSWNVQGMYHITGYDKEAGVTYEKIL